MTTAEMQRRASNAVRAVVPFRALHGSSSGVLRLRTLDPGARMVGRASLAVSGIACGLILLRGFGVTLPGGAENVRFAGTVPRVVIVFAYVGLAVAAATAASAATRPGWRLRRVTLVGVGLLGAAIAAATEAAAALIEPVGEFQRVPSWVPLFVRVCGWTGLGAAVAVAIAPIAIARRLSVGWPGLAAAPFVLALAVWSVVALTATQVPGLPPARAAIAGSVVSVVYGVGFASTLLLLWEGAMGARVARDVGASFVAVLNRRPSALTVLVGGKLAWVALGLAGALPAVLGGEAERWAASRSDGLLAWVLAGALAAAAATWLTTRGGRRLSDDGVEWAVGLVVVGLQMALLAATIGLFGFMILGLAPDSAAQRFFFRLADWSSDQILISQVVVVLVALALGLVLAWAGRAASAGAAFLVVFGVWAFPRALGIAIGEAGGNPPAFLRVEIVTLDAAITVAIACLLLLGRIAKRPRPETSLLGMAILAGAVIAYGGGLLDGAFGDRGFYLALVFPVAYQFFFAAQRLNRPDPDQAGRILKAVALSAAFMTIVAVQVTTGAVAPGATDLGTFAQLLLVVPLTAVLVASRRPIAARTSD